MIAEIGSTHGGSIKRAQRAIRAAARAGANAAKFQLFSAEKLYSKYTKDFANYKDIPKLMKSLELPREQIRDLAKECADNDIEFMASPFDEDAIKLLVDLGVKRLKIAGFEATDERFLKLVCDVGLPVIISVGIGFDSEKFEWLREMISNSACERFTFMHCNHSYPTASEDAELSMIQTLRHIVKDEWHWNDEYFDIGYSDHTDSVIAPAYAVAAGAKVIEKHMTLSNLLPDPDSEFSLTPGKFAMMVASMCEAEKFIGHGNFGASVSKSEEQFSSAMRSVVAVRDLKKGEILIANDITTKRPTAKYAVPASEFSSCIGKKMAHDVAEDMWLTIGDIER